MQHSSGEPENGVTKWLKATLNPKLGLSPEEITQLQACGILHSLPHEVNSILWGSVHDRVQETTGVREKEKGISPEFKSLVVGIRFILEYGDTSIRDTLSNQEILKLKVIKKQANDLEFDNVLRLFPIMSRKRLELMATNQSTFAANLPAKEATYRRGKTETTTPRAPDLRAIDWRQEFMAEATRFGCHIVADREESKSKHSEPGNSHLAIPPALQKVIFQLEAEHQRSTWGLLWEWEPSKTLLYSHLTPIGRAVYWMLCNIPYVETNQMLTQTISESYGLPPKSDYNFVFWEYVGRFLADDYLSPLHKIWTHNDILRQFGLEPTNRNLSYAEHLPIKYNYRIRPRLVKMGINPKKLAVLEARYVTFLSKDFQANHDLLYNNILFIVSAIIWKEKPELAKSIQNRLLTQFNGLRKINVDSLSWQQASNQFYSNLRDDPVLYMLFYSHVYQFDMIVKDFTKIANRKGPIRPIERLAIDSILCDFVDLIRATNSLFSFDLAAKAINALSGTNIYLRTRSESTGTKSTGGAVLKTDYYNLRHRISNDP